MMPYQYQFSDKIGLPWVIDTLPQFLFPDLSKKRHRINKPFCGVIATLEKKPVGLILATLANVDQTARIHSFFVQKNHRSKGLGHELLSHLQDRLKELGARELDLYYRSHWISVPAIEKILKTQRWSVPREDLLIVKGEAQKVLSLFTNRAVQLPADYSFRNFDQLTFGDRQAIQDNNSVNLYPEYLDPFIQEETIFTPSSIFLYHREKVVGWVISHLIAPDLSEFTALFVHPEHRPFKLAHLLMREAIYSQVEKGVTKFLITSKVDNPVMSRFLLRHAEATGVFLTRSLHSTKVLI